LGADDAGKKSKLKSDEQDAYAYFLENDAGRGVPELQRVFGARLRRRLQKFFEWLPTSVHDDVYEDTFVRVWDARNKYNEFEGSLEQWIWAIAKNAAYDKWRTDHRKQRRAEEREKRRVVAQSTQEFYQYREAIMKAIDQFSPTQKHILLADLEVYPDRADGKLLARYFNGCDVSSVYVQRNKAYEKLEKIAGVRPPWKRST